MQPCQLCLDAAVEDGISNAGNDATPQAGVHVDFYVDTTSGMCGQTLLETLDLLGRKLDSTANFGSGNASTLIKHLERSIDDKVEKVRPATLRHHLQKIERQTVDLAIEDCHQCSSDGSAIDQPIAEKLLQILRSPESCPQARQVASDRVGNIGLCGSI